uniref:Uncharacterized protein n=1 Tax=Panagrolaimus superbus TaxID=310955 RepID=A0A914YJJ5_9BILA
MSITDSKKPFSPNPPLKFDRATSQDESAEIKEDDEKHMGFSIVDILNAAKPKIVVRDNEDPPDEKPCNLSFLKPDSPQIERRHASPAKSPFTNDFQNMAAGALEQNQWLCSMMGAGMPINSWMSWFNAERLQGSILEQLRQQQSQADITHLKQKKGH